MKGLRQEEAEEGTWPGECAKVVDAERIVGRWANPDYDACARRLGAVLGWPDVGESGPGGGGVALQGGAARNEGRTASVGTALVFAARAAAFLVVASGGTLIASSAAR